MKENQNEVEVEVSVFLRDLLIEALRQHFCLSEQDLKRIMNDYIKANKEEIEQETGLKLRKKEEPGFNPKWN